MQEHEMASAAAKTNFSPILGRNLSKMEVRTFLRIQKVIWDQLQVSKAKNYPGVSFFFMFVSKSTH